MSTVPNHGDDEGGEVEPVLRKNEANRLRCLVVSFSDIGRDARVLRQIDVVAELYDVTVVGFGSIEDPRVEMITLWDPRRSRGRLGTALAKMTDAVRLILRRFRSAYYARPGVRQAQSALAHRQFDVVVANDVDALPVVCDTIQGAPIVLDAHEYSPEQHHRPLWRLLRRPEIMWICREYLERVAESMTIGEALATRWSEDFGLRPSVHRNVPGFVGLQPRPVDPSRMHLVHHGAAQPSREIERLIELVDLLDERFFLHLMLLPSDPRYFEKVLARAEQHPRVEIMDPVRPFEVVATIQAYDIGVYLHPPHSFNAEYSLPNKLFDFIQARLAVAIGPSVEMARVVQRYGLGVVAESFDAVDLAASLADVTPEQLAEWKWASHEAAKELCAEREAEVLVRAVERAAIPEFGS